MRTKIVTNNQKIDIYELIENLVNLSEECAYYRISTEPGMAAWDCEITLSRFGALKDANGLGYESISVVYKDESDAAEAFRLVKEKLCESELHYFKMFYCLQESTVTFVVNSLSDQGEPFGITKFLGLMDLIDSHVD